MSVPFGPTGEVVYNRTYSRTKEDGTKETWPETVRRVAEGNLRLVYGEGFWPQEVLHEYERLVYYMENMALLPAGRHLWATGVPGRQYLFNPLAYETEIVTRDGIKRIGDVAGAEVEVRDGNGAWTTARFKSFGNQPLRKITFRSGPLEKVVFATPDHGWFISGKNGEKRLSTDELAPGMKTPRTANRRGPLPVLSPVGVQAGFVFGDGTAYAQGATAYFCGDKDKNLLRYFEGLGAPDRGDGVLRTGTVFPRSWKNPPSVQDGTSFLYGWLAGYFAADGCVSENGSASLASASKENLQAARDVAAVLGIDTTPIRTYVRQGYGDSPSEIHYLTLSNLPKEFFLIETHRDRVLDKKRNRQNWTVSSVEATDRTETVYCATIGTTHSFMLADGLRTGNCHVAGWGEELWEHFEFSFLRLMEGGGVGANYSVKHIEKYGIPKGISDVQIVADYGHQDFEELRPHLSTKPWADWVPPFKVEDSREGWADALCHLIHNAMTDSGRVRIVFDVSGVRPSGSELKTFGGTASGPAPLARMLLDVADILNGAYKTGVLTPLDVMAIDHAIAECVVSGGNRRSARMSIVKWDDPYIMQFLSAKQDTGLHWTTNISVEIDDEFLKELEFCGSKAKEVHAAVVKGMLTNGEPGYWNSSLSNKGEVNTVEATNPCGEIALEAWENCNLGHVNLDWFWCRPKSDLYEAHRLMTRFLMRATYGDVNDEKQAQKLALNRRIGVGHLGVQGYWAKQGVRYSDIPSVAADELDTLYQVVRKEARDYAFKLRIPEPVKVTAVAPTGSVAKLPGVSEGIHPIYARHFERRVRFSKRDEAQFNTVMEAMSQGFAVEDDVYDKSGMTAVVVYPTEELLMSQVRSIGLSDDVVESADELSIRHLLAVQYLYQKHYADNAVSYTVNIVDGDLDEEELADVLAEFLPYLKGTTVMVDASRPQAPYTRITQEEFLSATAVAIEDGISEECSNGACPVR